jgi:hypothetical protein
MVEKREVLPFAGNHIPAEVLSAGFTDRVNLAHSTILLRSLHEWKVVNS